MNGIVGQGRAWQGKGHGTERDGEERQGNVRGMAWECDARQGTEIGQVRSGNVRRGKARDKESCVGVRLG